MKLETMTTIFAVTLLAAASAFAQDRLPEREYTNPEELVVLDESVPFSEALAIFDDLSEEFRGKIIIDRSEFDGPIGVDIARMHWFDALEQIADYNDLLVVERERYIELRDVPEEPEEEERTRERDLTRRPTASRDERVVTFEDREIEIKATFFEASRDIVRDLGIDWSTLSSDGRISVTSADRVNDEVLSAALDLNDIGGSGIDITALFNAIESSNLGEIISTPTVKVMEGEEGRIQVGQDFSIRQRDFAGNVIDRFYSVGTILEVRPQIFYHEETPFIFMTLRAERSTAVPGALTTVVNKQEAETQVLLLNGESTIMAGLYETEEREIRQGVPILKDLPGWFFGLRYLFGYNSDRYDVNELVVLLEVNLVPSLQERLDGQFQRAPELIEQQRDMNRRLNQEIIQEDL
ncbi:MAG: type II and III secretion system protein [Cyclonatronaceae bacterium]